MGRVRLGQKQYDAAVVHLEQAAAKLPDDATVQASLGEAYKKLERHADAANAYGAAFKANPSHGNYGLEQGQALRRAKQLENAENVLREVAKVDKQAEFVFTELGDVLREQGKLDEALKTYDVSTFERWLQSALKALVAPSLRRRRQAGAADRRGDQELPDRRRAAPRAAVRPCASTASPAPRRSPPSRS
jgi:tetratricopeptide (TPR) repeat protein